MRWIFKVIIKLMIARIPIPYKLWRAIGLFRHGHMDSINYSHKIFNLHIARSYGQGVPGGMVMLEIGPGDSVASSLLAFAIGARRVYLLDVGDFACKDITFYKSFAKDMIKRGMRAPNLEEAKSFDDILRLCNAEYLVDGISSLRNMPAASIDFIWSHSTLEHVRKYELEELMRELLRVLKPGALSSHNIDYQDHLDSALNNLRIPEFLWESSLVSSSGFYTNRIPAVRMHALFKDVGFEILQEEYGKWPKLPTPLSAMQPEFQKFPDADLINRTSSVLLKA